MRPTRALQRRTASDLTSTDRGAIGGNDLLWTILVILAIIAVGFYVVDQIRGR